MRLAKGASAPSAAGSGRRAVVVHWHAAEAKERRGPVAVVLCFVRPAAELTRSFPAAARATAEGGRLWICWPKKASGLAADLGETEIRAFGLARGFVDYKICAVDATWSGLCFARRSHRPPRRT